MEESEIRSTIASLTVMSIIGPPLADKIVDVLMNVSAEETMASNKALFTKGEESTDTGVVILEGELSVIKDGVPEIITHGPQLMGEMGRLNPLGKRTATVTTVTEIKFLRFTWPGFMSEIESRFSESDVERVTSALQDYAWQHFTA